MLHSYLPPIDCMAIDWTRTMTKTESIVGLIVVGLMAAYIVIEYIVKTRKKDKNGKRL